jgi:hypothetical protein
MTEPWWEDVFEDVSREHEARAPRGGKSNGKGHDAGKRFQLKRFEDIKLATRPNYLIKGVLPRTGLAVIWGPPKCGKSFWTFDAAMHVALGWQYRGRRVQQGTVVYCALEGGAGFAARVEAWRQRHLAQHCDPVPFHLLDVPLDLVGDHMALIATIREQVEELPVAAVFIDTLNRAMLGDENKSDDMAKFIRAADALRVAFECLVGVIHHCGVAGSRPRGHTSLAGADDVQIQVERDKDGNITVTVEHMKDGDASAPMGSKLERLEVGTDDDGDPMSSCVIVPAEVTAVARKLSKTQKFALDALKKCVTNEPRLQPPMSPYSSEKWPCVASARWRQEFYDTYPSDKPATKRQALLRATLDLEEASIIVLWKEYVWLRDSVT